MVAVTRSVCWPVCQTSTWANRSRKAVTTLCSFVSSGRVPQTTIHDIRVYLSGVGGPQSGPAGARGDLGGTAAALDEAAGGVARHPRGQGGAGPCPGHGGAVRWGVNFFGSDQGVDDPGRLDG